ncbi:DUF3558 domain-containing protein [Pseudonocardia sp. GCM10023141]|uniref:DUF3558 domain-containing protein n=1 Tax=Pseudonocardia sp. GCM10023141 TaxID=3252653 RepID=UPI0036237E59
MLAGCASPASSASAPTAPSTAIPSTSRPLPRFAPSVQSPLDARGLAPCDLLTSAQATELDLLPETAKAGIAGPAKTCTWDSRIGGGAAGLQMRTESELPVLDGIHLLKEALVVFEPTEVAGHPAIHGDYTVDGACTIYTAIADYQILTTDGDLSGHTRPDKCAPSRRMAELILSNLPPLRS